MLELIETLPKIAAHPLAIAAYIVVVIAWLLAYFRRARTHDFLVALERLPKSERAGFASRSGYKYDELARLPNKERIRVLNWRYLIIAYISTLVAIVLVVVAVFVAAGQKPLITDGTIARWKKNIRQVPQLVEITKDVAPNTSVLFNMEAFLGIIDVLEFSGEEESLDGIRDDLRLLVSKADSENGNIVLTAQIRGKASTLLLHMTEWASELSIQVPGPKVQPVVPKGSESLPTPGPDISPNGGTPEEPESPTPLAGDPCLEKCQDLTWEAKDDAILVGNSLWREVTGRHPYYDLPVLIQNANEDVGAADPRWECPTMAELEDLWCPLCKNALGFKSGDLVWSSDESPLMASAIRYDRKKGMQRETIQRSDLAHVVLLRSVE